MVMMAQRKDFSDAKCSAHTQAPHLVTRLQLSMPLLHAQGADASKPCAIVDESKQAL
jgi:hypothetical protein